MWVGLFWLGLYIIRNVKASPVATYMGNGCSHGYRSAEISLIFLMVTNFVLYFSHRIPWVGSGLEML